MSSEHTASSPPNSGEGPGNGGKWIGSISGKQSSSGIVEELEGAGSFDSENYGGTKSPTAEEQSLAQLSQQQQQQLRARVYSEDDDEMRVAKAMALAMQNNPNMTPDEMKQLQNQLVSKTTGLTKSSPPIVKSTPTDHNNSHAGVPNLFASVGASMANLQKDIEKKTKNVPIVKNMEKMTKQFQDNITKMTGGVGHHGSSESGETTTASTSKSTPPTTNNFPSLLDTTAKEASSTVAPTKTKRKDVVNPKPPPTHSGAASSPTSAPTTKTVTPKSLEVPNMEKTATLTPANMDQPQAAVSSTGDDTKGGSISATTTSTTIQLPPSMSLSASAVSTAKPSKNISVVPPVISASAPTFPSVSIAKATAAPALRVKTSTATSAAVTDLILPPDMENAQIRLTATVWKRRSGFGKLSVKHGWERRRVVLVGPKVVYYKSLKEEEEEDDVDDHNPASGGAFEDLSDAEVGEDSKKSWLEQAAKNLEKNIEKTKAETLAFIKTESDPNAPRGILDLVKERASVAAATGHSGAPTPFAISIKVKSETKWKFCFDSRPEQMDWLAALTDVVVVSSVDAYNAALVAAADPTHQQNQTMIEATNPLQPLFQTTPTLSEPSAISPPDSPKGAAPFVKSGHRLWMLQPYIIKSEGFLSPPEIMDVTTTSKSRDVCLDDESEEEEPELEEELASPADQSLSSPVIPFTFNSSTGIPSILSSQPLSLRGTNISIVVVIFNAALFYANSSSTDIDNFWYLITFVNLALWFLLVDEISTTGSASLNAQIGNASGTKSATKKESRSSKGSKKGNSDKNAGGIVGDKTQSAKAKVPPKPAYKPIAGTTTILLENESDEPRNKEGHVFAGYRQPKAGDVFHVRSHGYLATKKKIPAPGELYNLINVDIFESGSRYPDMAKRVQLPEVNFDDEEGFVKTWHAPDIMVISVSLPTDPPKMGRSGDDGGGYTITMYFAMKKDVRDILKRVTDPNYDPSEEPKVEDVQQSKVNASKLLNEWCRRSPTDPKFQARFKLIVDAQNLKEIGVPGWITKYNAKPMLIKRSGVTGFLYSHPELNAMEFDVSLHPFPYLAKQGICYLKENAFKNILACFGFLIEGRSDDELPECMIGQMQLCYPDPAHAIQGPDFFAGTSPSSLA